MREIRLSGLEGGVAVIRHPYPYISPRGNVRRTLGHVVLEGRQIPLQTSSADDVLLGF